MQLKNAKGAAMEETKNPAVVSAEEAEDSHAGETEEKNRAAQREKLRKRHLRELRSLIVRLVLLLFVVYILFFHLVGVTVMPNADMYPTSTTSKAAPVFIIFILVPALTFPS